MSYYNSAICIIPSYSVLVRLLILSYSVLVRLHSSYSVLVCELYYSVFLFLFFLPPLSAVMVCSVQAASTITVPRP